MRVSVCGLSYTENGIVRRQQRGLRQPSVQYDERQQDRHHARPRRHRQELHARSRRGVPPESVLQRQPRQATRRCLGCFRTSCSQDLFILRIMKCNVRLILASV